ncbi:MAG: choice-of-anchor tandem repeat GloVer-containing protein [Verrucomicrobiota bacterium]
MKTVLKFALLAMCASALSGHAQEKTSFHVLHTFAPATNGLAGLRINSDGLNIHSALTASDTALYGTATEGGTNGTGVIFKINSDGSGFTLLHQFSAPSPRIRTTFIPAPRAQCWVRLAEILFPCLKIWKPTLAQTMRFPSD